MLLRAALVVVCAAAIVFGATRLHQVDSCEHTRTTVLALLCYLVALFDVARSPRSAPAAP